MTTAADLVFPCKECARPLRPIGVEREEAPGTVRHAGRGLCGGCYSRWRRHAARELSAEAPTEPVATDDHTAALHRERLAEYMADRRRRGIPATGLEPSEYVARRRREALHLI